MNPQAMILGVQLTRQHANSAMPDAPVLPVGPATNPRLRRATARALRRMADRMEPIT
jgi:hypothetical protein